MKRRKNLTNLGRDSRKEGSNSLDTPIPLILLHQRMLEEEARVEPAHVVVPTQRFSIASDPYSERAPRLAAAGKKQKYSRKVACEPHTSSENDYSNTIGRLVTYLHTSRYSSACYPSPSAPCLCRSSQAGTSAPSESRQTQRARESSCGCG